MILVGSRVNLIKNTVIEHVSVDKNHPMAGVVIQITRRKIGNNMVKMCLFCPDKSKDKHSGYEVSSKWLIEIKD